MGRIRATWFGVLMFISAAAVSEAALQFPPKDGCADCHIATPSAPGEAHVLEWDRSPHGRSGVSCSACHGGNRATFERFRAHDGIIGPSNRRSPLHPPNIPGTCGRCHPGPFAAFQSSRHFALLGAGNTKAPTCVTCHGETDGRLLSAKALASRCASCHGPKEEAARAGRVETVRELYESLSGVRRDLKLATDLIKRVNDSALRAQLTDAVQMVESPLTRAVYAGHTFEYDELRRSLTQAQERVGALLGRLANR